jgi:hypothetical protein
MINLLIAEGKKTVWNYLLTGFLVWAYPVGMSAFYLLMLAGGLLSRDWLLGLMRSASGMWTEDAIGSWGIVLAFPFTVLTRLMPLAFMAAVFAGEYQSAMWKILIPRSRRAHLILAKMTVVIALIAASIVTTSVVSVALQGAVRRLVGLAYLPAVSGGDIASFAVRYGQTALLGILALIILAAMAALAAVLSRSVLGSLLAAFGFSTVDSLSMYLLLLLSRMFSAPGLVDLYRFAPQYNLDNAQSWFRTGAAVRLPIEGFSARPDLAFSLGMLALWAAGLTALMLAVFQRQDITS